MTASMSRRCDCWERAACPRVQRADGKFLGTLKNELVHHRKFETRQQAIEEITEYLEIFYNGQRKQERLGYLSPAAFT